MLVTTGWFKRVTMSCSPSSSKYVPACHVQRFVSQCICDIHKLTFFARNHVAKQCRKSCQWKSSILASFIRGLRIGLPALSAKHIKLFYRGTSTSFGYIVATAARPAMPTLRRCASADYDKGRIEIIHPVLYRVCVAASSIRAATSFGLET